MSPLVLSSTSAATDAAWLAAADVSAIAHELGAEYRLIGGIAISLLVHHHGVGAGVPDRDTADADMGVPFEVLSDDRLPGALLAHGYAPLESNRFRRSHPRHRCPRAVVGGAARHQPAARIALRRRGARTPGGSPARTDPHRGAGDADHR